MARLRKNFKKIIKKSTLYTIKKLYAKLKLKHLIMFYAKQVDKVCLIREA